MNDYFPYEKLRNGQEDFIDAVEECLNDSKSLIVHAPTGIGKTAAALAPCLKYAIEHDRTVFFLTSRHTQHKIVIDTLNSIKKKTGMKFNVADIIGKRWMCALDGLESYGSSDFFDFCKNKKLNDNCKFYSSIKENNKLSLMASDAIEEFQLKDFSHAEEIQKKAKEKGLCGFEISLQMAKNAHVIVTDYSYIFSTHIRESLLPRMNKTLDKAILIIDEGHNLSNRLRDMMSATLSGYIINNAIHEAKENSFKELQAILETFKRKFSSLLAGFEKERHMPKEEFERFVNDIIDYNDFQQKLKYFSEMVKIKKERSWLGSFLKFLDTWQTGDKSIVRILKNDKGRYSLNVVSLDASIVSEPILSMVHSAIIMSGTLKPTSMFRDLLGFKLNTKLMELENPFPKENRLSLIVPITSTSYKRRTKEEYQRIGYAAGFMASLVPGNTAIFFPSYEILNSVKDSFDDNYNRKFFLEKSGMSKEDKQELLNLFSSNAEKGSALLAVMGGSFSEGIDLPGDLLKAVIVVGIPFSVPDLQTKALIEYFDKKFKKGMDYGYIYPAVTLALQCAGRCIRSESDKGLIIFMDERYPAPNFLKYFPKDWNFEITRNFEPLIDDFFK